VGWLSEATFRVARDSSFPNDIRFTGFIADRELVALYSGAEAFAYPSLYEGFGLPVLEAMACGTPVICANTSSLPEFAGDSALLVPPGDADAIADAMEAVCGVLVRQDLIKRGTQRARTYTWQRSARQLVDIYRTVGQAA
jgi:glycosyltransferase involved in cell wall biosynthesis